MNQIIKALNWRYATKKFDPTKKISNLHIDTLKEAIQLTPTSYGLQLFKVQIISDQETKQQLLPFSWNQQQIVDASDLFVFCRPEQVSDEMIESFTKIKASLLKKPVEEMEGYTNFVKKTITNFSKEEQQIWMEKQIYIALGIFLDTCAQLKIDSCPMEGFQPEEYNKLLELDKKNLHATLVVPIGYRAIDDKSQHLPKIRRSINELFI